MVSRHRRFELLEVELGGVPIGKATIDVWDDAAGRMQWSARVLMKSGQQLIDGSLSGSTRDGRTLKGEVRVGEGQQGPRGARTMLVELHGQGPLAGADGIDPRGEAVPRRR